MKKPPVLKTKGERTRGKGGPKCPEPENTEVSEASAFSKASENADTLEKRRERQREVCWRLLQRWIPVAASEDLAVREAGREGPIVDEEPLEDGLKAGAFVLKVLERLAKIDGLDAVEKREGALPETADPVELAQRIKVVSPLLMARLQLAGKLQASPAEPAGVPSNWRPENRAPESLPRAGESV